MIDDVRDNLNLYYMIKIDALKLYKKYCEQWDEYELAAYTDGLIKIVEETYIDFYLKEYDSEGRKVIRKVYKILGYNPYNPKQIK